MVAFSDDFNRANGAVANGWSTNGAGTVDIVSNELRMDPGSLTAHCRAYRAAPYADIAVEAVGRVNANYGAGYWWGVEMRSNVASTQGYLLMIYYNAFVYLWEWDGAGGFGYQTVATVTPSASNTLRLEMLGSNFTASVNGAVVLRKADTTFTTAQNVGLYADSCDARIDSFLYDPAAVQSLTGADQEATGYVYLNVGLGTILDQEATGYVYENVGVATGPLPDFGGEGGGTGGLGMSGSGAVQAPAVVLSKLAERILCTDEGVRLPQFVPFGPAVSRARVGICDHPSDPVFDGSIDWWEPDEVAGRLPLGYTAPWTDICAIELEDGRVLVVWQESGNIYQAIAPNTTTLFESDGWIDDPAHPSQARTQLFTGYSRCAAFEIDGGIYMSMLSFNNDDGMMGAWYARYLGGTSWERYGVVYEEPFTESDFGLIHFADYNIGVVTVFNDIWFLPTAELYWAELGGSSYHDYKVAIYASQDFGVSWSAVWRHGGSLGVGNFQMGRMIGVFNGTMYYSADWNVQGTTMVASTDGLLWNETYLAPDVGPDGIMQVSVTVSDDNYIYIMKLNGLLSPEFRSSLYRTTDPTQPVSAWELMAGYNQVEDFGLVVVQQVGCGFYAVMDAAGTVIGLPIPRFVPRASVPARSQSQWIKNQHLS